VLNKSIGWYTILHIDEINKHIKRLEQRLQEKEQLIEQLQEAVRSSEPSGYDADRVLQGEIDRLKLNYTSLMEQAHQANKSKSAFLEKVSHELLTSMNGMLGMLSVVFDTELSTQQRRYLEMVNSSAERLMETVQDILDFSQIEIGRFVFKSIPFHLREALEFEMYPQCKNAEQQNVDISFYLEPGVPMDVEGDSERLMQVVANLLSAALAFGQQERLALEIASKGYDKDGMFWLRFSLVSSGEILDQKNSRELLDAFRGDTIPAPSTDSISRMGVVVSGHLVRLVGGEIGIESNDTESRIWFTWPLAAQVDEEHGIKGLKPPTRSYPSLGATLPLEGKKILVAEDDPTNRVLVETVLSLAGADITSVGDGEAAYNEYIRGDYRMVIMDIQMPIMDGLKAAKKIRQYEKKHGGHVAIIALTANALQGSREQCLAAGMDSYAAKPINKNQLIELVSGYLSHRVLIVGHQQVHQSMVISLRELGWGVTLASTTKEAYSSASENSFNVIFINFVTHAEAFGLIKSVAQLGGLEPRFIGLAVSDENRMELLSSVRVDDVLPVNAGKAEICEVLDHLDFSPASAD